mgnify:FL=1
MNRRVLVSLSLIVGGGALLFLTTGTITVGGLLIPLVLIVAGGILLWRAFLPEGGEGNVFAGTFLLLSGGFWLLWEAALPAVELRAIWPVFMTTGGMALIAYGFKRGSELRMPLIVPGVVIVALSVLFLLFSLDVIDASLAEVAVSWWPILLVVLGFAMISRHSDPEE